LAFLASFRLRSRQAWREQIPFFGEPRATGKFAQGAKISKHSNTEFAEFGEFFKQELVYSAPSASPRCNLRAMLHIKA